MTISDMSKIKEDQKEQDAKKRAMKIANSAGNEKAERSKRNEK